MARAFFECFERNLGRISDLVEPKAVQRVLSSRRLESAHLKALLSHECAAVHVLSFMSPHAAASLAQRLVARDATATSSRPSSWEVANGRGMESSDVRAVGGIPFAMAMDSARRDPSQRDEYFRRASEEILWLRGLGVGAEIEGECTPVLSPLDRLRLELDEAWPAGATLLKDQATGLPFLPGIGRIMEGPTRWADGFCHVDDLAPMGSSGGLFSANIYLEMPPVGGNLQVWPVAWQRRYDFYRHASLLSGLTTPDEGGQRALRRAFPKPLELAPRPGDLVILCAQRPHAVQGFPLGRRVSLQSFITHKEGKPLTIDN